MKPTHCGIERTAFNWGMYTELSCKKKEKWKCWRFRAPEGESPHAVGTHDTPFPGQVPVEPGGAAPSVSHGYH